MPQDPQQSSYTKKCPTCLGAGCSWQRAGDDYVAMPCDVCLGTGSILVLVTPAPSGREVLADAGAFERDVQTSPRILADEFGSPVGSPVGGYSWGAK